MDTIREDLRIQLAEKGVDELPMPQIAHRILTLAFGSASDPAQLADLIQREPTLTGQVMRIANLQFYRAVNEIESLHQAIGRLGYKEVQNLTVALALRGQVFRAPGHEADIDELWRESVAAAVWAKAIGEARRKEADIAYLCGLLHQIGRVAVVRVVTRIERERRMVYDARSFTLLLDEFEREFAQKVVSAWALPQRISAAVLGWRSYESLANHREEAAISHAAHQLATVSLHPALMQVEYLVSNPVFAELNLDIQSLESLLGRTEEIKSFIDAL